MTIQRGEVICYAGCYCRQGRHITGIKFEFTLKTDEFCLRRG